MRLPEFNVRNVLIGTGLLAALVVTVGVVGGSKEGRVLRIASSYVGQKETGANSGPDIDKFNQGKRVAWCMGFVSYVLKQAGLAKKTELSVRTVYDRAKALGVLSTEPSLGAVFLQINTGMDLDGVDKGGNHTGFIVGDLLVGKMATIEGNYSNKVARATRRPSEIQGYIALKDVAKVFA